MEEKEKQHKTPKKRGPKGKVGLTLTRVTSPPQGTPHPHKRHLTPTRDTSPSQETPHPHKGTSPSQGHLTLTRAPHPPLPVLVWCLV